MLQTFGVNSKEEKSKIKFYRQFQNNLSLFTGNRNGIYELPHDERLTTRILGSLGISRETLRMHETLAYY